MEEVKLEAGNVVSLKTQMTINQIVDGKAECLYESSEKGIEKIWYKLEELEFVRN